MDFALLKESSINLIDFLKPKNMLHCKTSSQVSKTLNTKWHFLNALNMLLCI